MVTLEALLEAGALSDGISIVELARRSHSILTRSPELSRDRDGVAELGGGRGFDETRFVSYWKDNPIAASARERLSRVDYGRGRRHLDSRRRTRWSSS
ncbi:hypothetical protein ACMHYB_38880 [Sorangium sp. So ce1128]